MDFWVEIDSIFIKKNRFKICWKYPHFHYWYNEDACTYSSLNKKSAIVSSGYIAPYITIVQNIFDFSTRDPFPRTQKILVQLLI